MPSRYFRRVFNGFSTILVINCFLLSRKYLYYLLAKENFVCYNNLVTIMVKYG